MPADARYLLYESYPTGKCACLGDDWVHIRTAASATHAVRNTSTVAADVLRSWKPCTALAAESAFSGKWSAQRQPETQLCVLLLIVITGRQKLMAHGNHGHGQAARLTVQDLPEPTAISRQERVPGWLPRPSQCCC